MNDDDLGNMSMLALFAMEVEGQAVTLSDGLLALEQNPTDGPSLEALMRAAHSIKGAARMVGVEAAVQIAHVMEDCFVMAQESTLLLDDNKIDTLLEGVDMLNQISALDETEAAAWLSQHQSDIDALVKRLEAMQTGADDRIITAQPPQTHAAPVIAQAVPPAPTKTKVTRPLESTIKQSANIAPTEPAELADLSMLDLFRIEAESQTQILADGMLNLEQDPDDNVNLEVLMRAAHSIKGAARMVGVDAAVRIAHTMEDGFVMAQEGALIFTADSIDIFLKGNDKLREIAELDESGAAQWFVEQQGEIDDIVNQICCIQADTHVNSAPAPAPAPAPESSSMPSVTATPVAAAPAVVATAITAQVPTITEQNNVGEADLADLSMLQLFRVEAESQTDTLTEGLLQLEQNPTNSDNLETLMRAAHSIKGAARMVGVDPAVQIAHVMEDSFVMAQEGNLTLSADNIDTLLKGVDKLRQIALLDENEAAIWLSDQTEQINALVNQIDAIRTPQDDLRAAGTSIDVPASRPKAQTTSSPDTKKTVAAIIPKAEPPKKLASNVVTQQPPVSVPKPEASTNGSSEATSIADVSMLELFNMEAEEQCKTLSDGLLNLESDPANGEILERLMRAAHSIKGAARMVGVDAAVGVAHTMEDSFVMAQEGKFALNTSSMDTLLKGVDMIKQISELDEGNANEWLNQQADAINALCQQLESDRQGNAGNGQTTVPKSAAQPAPKQPAPKQPAPKQPAPNPAAQSAEKTNNKPVDKKPAPQKTKPQQRTVPPAATKAPDKVKSATFDTKAPEKSSSAKKKSAASRDAVIRVSASSLNRLLGLAGETMVESRWVRPFADSLLGLKRRHAELIGTLDVLREAIVRLDVEEQTSVLLKEAQQKATSCREVLTDRISDLEAYDRRVSNLAERLNREVICSRMRPFSDGIQGFQRMVRDVSRSLGKSVKLNIEGPSTQVDRDILEKIEAPLNHLIRNGIDHGLETPEIRKQNGKPEQGTILLHASHTSGMLTIRVEDDGRGVDVENIRAKVVEKNMATAKMAADMTEAELLDFLFLPSFSTKDNVTEISGRGVGLDVVHSVVQEMRGVVRATSEVGAGTRFHMQLPLTLSVIRALLVEISGEPYAIPLARIDSTTKIDPNKIETMEGRQYISQGDQHIGIIEAYQVLDLMAPEKRYVERPLIILGERLNRYGLLVEKFLGERDLVVQVLDSRLGKVKNIAAAAILDDGSPTLIVDVDDLLRSIDILISRDRINAVSKDGGAEKTKKTILVVDDSVTVRQVERNLLETRGYAVDVAVDGMDGWNAARMGSFDLIISDVDMPRMNGFEFVEMIKRDPRLKSTPVMIVSYKEREEDRLRGLEVGADYYLTKGSFHDDTLMNAVADLIGRGNESQQ